MNIISLFLIIGAIIGFFIVDSFLLFLVVFELIILAINFELVLSSIRLDNNNGIFMCLLLLATAAVDTAIGLGILLRNSHVNAILGADQPKALKG